jgi:hypothetical protein
LKEYADEENRGTKNMQTKDLTDILSAIDIAAEKLCDIDHDCEGRSKVNRGIRAILHPYYKILQKKKKITTVDVKFFLDVFRTTAWAFFSKIKSDLNYIFFSYLSNFYILNSLN